MPVLWDFQSEIDFISLGCMARGKVRRSDGESWIIDDRRSIPTEKASEEVLLFEGFGNFCNERPARLVFLFLGGFLLGCHEVYPSVLNDFYSPKVLDKAP